jgi:hypothetical protein
VQTSFSYPGMSVPAVVDASPEICADHAGNGGAPRSVVLSGLDTSRAVVRAVREGMAPAGRDQSRVHSHATSRAHATIAAEIALIHELLDAHDDTALMAGELALKPCWQAHLDYLRALQRRGRELVAQLAREASVGA